MGVQLLRRGYVDVVVAATVVVVRWCLIVDVVEPPCVVVVR